MSDRERPVIAVCVPRTQLVLAQCADSIHGVMRGLADAGYEVNYTWFEGALVHDARNKLVATSLDLDPSPDYVLFLDADMKFPETGAAALVRRATKHDLKILSGLYFHRGPPYKPHWYKATGAFPDRWGSDKSMYFLPMRGEVFDFITKHMAGVAPGEAYCAEHMSYEDAVMELDACGAGFLLVAREVFEAIHPPWFHYKWSGGEDFNFCMEAKKAGYRIYGDAAVIAGHMAFRAVGPLDFAQHYEASGLRAADQAWQELSVELQNYLELCPADLANAALRATPGLATAWSANPPKDPAEVREWYRQVGKLYILDLARWNATPMFLGMMQQLAREPFGNGRALDFGSGIGTAALRLQEAGWDAECVEIAPDLQDFIRWRAQRRGVNLPVHEALDAIDGQFCLIVAIDVLEHIHPAEFEDVLRALIDHLAPGGALFAHNMWKSGGVYPQHYDNSPAWNRLITEAGLAQAGQYEWRKP